MTLEVFNENRVFAMLQEMAHRYIIFSDNEIQKWNENSLEFFMDQKEGKNEMRGNYLREKARILIAQISYRFGAVFENFCKSIIQELQSEDLSSGSVDSQRKRDAIYQILCIRLCDENDVDIEPFVKLI
jgi:hypothetical protein